MLQLKKNDSRIQEILCPYVINDRPDVGGKLNLDQRRSCAKQAKCTVLSSIYTYRFIVMIVKNLF